MDILTTIATRLRGATQRDPADERQVLNGAGGYAYPVTPETRVRRFLTLGTDGGTYYATERDLTADTAAVVLDAARERGAWLVGEVVAISTAGRAPRQNPALFALAAAASLADDEGRAAALDALPLVARTGTHLFLFARYASSSAAGAVGCGGRSAPGIRRRRSPRSHTRRSSTASARAGRTATCSASPTRERPSLTAGPCSTGSPTAPATSPACRWSGRSPRHTAPQTWRPGCGWSSSTR